MRRVLLVMFAAAFLVSACGGAEPPAAQPSEDPSAFDGPVPADAEAYPVMVSAELVEGENRVLIGVLSDQDAPIGSPDLDVSVDFYDLEDDDGEPDASADMSFIETVPGERGLYVGYATFDSAGSWGAEVHMSGDGIDEMVRTSFDVLEEGSTPAVGAPAPSVDTPTAADVDDLSMITTDEHPDRDFYSTSIASALKNGEPFVVTFATPKFCASAVCGPTLDIVKDVAEDYPRITFIHVEVYENLDDPSNLVVVPAVEKWGLPTEPWVFVVNDKGRIAAKFEGSVGAAELAAALDEL